MNKKNILLILIISLPLWGTLLKFGIHTTHDYHIFRQQQFNICAIENSIPCRWSPDAGFGYGEPMFNFYGQTPYVFGYLFGKIGFSIIDSVKFLYILSISLSGITMYLFSRKLFGNKGGMISAIAYMYAPYRAVDVWVRGALPEAISFVIFPVILLSSYEYINSKNKKFLPILSISTAFLITSHNLSAFMFAPFAVMISIYWICSTKNYKSTLGLIVATLFSVSLSLYYLLPVIFEKNLITLNLTTENYFNFTNHYVSVYQLFISRFWGYGGSTWGPNDTLSFSVGHIQWLVSLLVVVITLLKFRKTNIRRSLQIFTFFLLACFSLFLTHGKSDFIWQNLPGLGYIQFPWRFISISILMFSVIMGGLQSFKKLSLVVISLLLILLNSNFFKPDIWQNVSDREFFSGESETKQIASTVQDYWPSQAKKLPQSPAPANPYIVYGEGDVSFQKKGAHHSTIEARIYSNSATIVIPMSNFPNWTVLENNKIIDHFSSGDLNLITFNLAKGDHIIDLYFKNTPVRNIGNIASLIAILLFIIWSLKQRNYEK